MLCLLLLSKYILAACRLRSNSSSLTSVPESLCFWFPCGPMIPLIVPSLSSVILSNNEVAHIPIVVFRSAPIIILCLRGIIIDEIHNVTDMLFYFFCLISSCRVIIIH